ncbi:flap endonuclease GEN-like 1 [Impatiens glandulifera]|uniref:flap endonuclease GEN-like 1 n=1 Tax=Impatiens glandulifera TaxID=253017 RepID=UPI001FB0A450|nr:flap endonuclease GEN-like 1 [Impatiens glandulifera]
MGVGGNFWDLLKPYARNEGFDFIRDKRVAVDLSFWVVQNETAIGANARNPHLRLIFFRTVNLFAKFGAYPVFIVDGTPSLLKSQARIQRYYRSSGIDVSAISLPEDASPVERNRNFSKCIAESVELLKLLGVPVLKARGEAEALCAQLNFEGLVDACITADSDAFMFGAQCVIKRLNPNNKEPFECYNMSDIEAGLGLKRNHLIAISILVGNDHNLGGVQGIGVDTALRFVKSFGEDEVLNRLRDIGKGDDTSRIQVVSSFETNTRTMKKSPHCSFCGHPGSKRAHLKSPCEYCSSNNNDGCVEKIVGFECRCSSCDLNRKGKEKKKDEDWHFRVCQKIETDGNFRSDEIIELYSSDNNYQDKSGVRFQLRWENPKVDMLVDYLCFYLNWEPSYIRQRILPMLCTIFLRHKALKSTNDLLNKQYEFDSIQRVKVKFGHQFYVVNWKKNTPALAVKTCTVSDLDRDDSVELTQHDDDDPGPPEIYIRDGCHFLSTDENMSLVQAAFPEKVQLFWEEKERRESGKRKKQSPTMESPSKRGGMQLNITEFYRSSKKLNKPKTKGESSEEDQERSGYGSSKVKRNVDSSSNLPKSVRRRLLFG